MYLRYTQPPADLYDWYEDYLQDEEEIDVKAGGGQTITIGQMVYQFLTKLDWFSTLFPRIPVPIQKQIEKKLEQYCRDNGISQHQLGFNSNTRSAGGSKSNYVPVQNETGGRGSYANEEYEQRRSRGSGSRGPPPISYRSEHDDREPYRERRRDYADDDYKESVRDYERARERYRERKMSHSRERGRSRDRVMQHSRDPEIDRERESMRSRDRDRDYHRRDYDEDKRDDIERERVRMADESKERHRNKHKKKKHKHHRSRSRSQSKREKKRERESTRDNGDHSLTPERRYR